MQSEDQLIEWLRSQQERSSPSLIGDDGAILPTAESWVVTMDAQREGVHFLPGTAAAVVARRLLAVNLSDLAAMGAMPAFAFLALSAPADFPFKNFFTALRAACQSHGMELAGGDLSQGEAFHGVLTLLGRKPSAQRWLRRGDARPGERLWVGGTLGEAATGLVLLQAGACLRVGGIELPRSLDLPSHLHAHASTAMARHLRPSPQLELGQWLGQQAAGAAMDVSDGLAKDLHRLCKESRVGAEVDAARLPIPAEQRAIGRHLGRDPERLALSGGEDYVLLFSLPPDLEPPAHFACHTIGRIVEGADIILKWEDRSEPLKPLGWDHLCDPKEIAEMPND